MPDFTEEIATIAAALSEGFCPAGHRLSYGGGVWGSCNTCQTGWTVHPAGVSIQPYGKDGHWFVSPEGEYWFVDQNENEYPKD